MSDWILNTSLCLVSFMVSLNKILHVAAAFIVDFIV